MSDDDLFPYWQRAFYSLEVETLKQQQRHDRLRRFATAACIAFGSDTEGDAINDLRKALLAEPEQQD